MVLERQDHQLVVLREGGLVDGGQDVLEEYLGGPVDAVHAVVDDRFSVVAVPDIQLHAATAARQHAPVLIHVAVTIHLVVNR